MKIKLSQGLFATVSPRDYPHLQQFNWFAWRPSSSPHLCYAVRKVRLSSGRYSKRLMHREIIGALRGEEVDHRDGNGLNNLRGNLRIATASQNQANSRKHRDAFHSKFKGVTWHKRGRCWQVSCQKQGDRRFLFGFQSERSAARAYNRLARSLHGRFSRGNKI